MGRKPGEAAPAPDSSTTVHLVPRCPGRPPVVIILEGPALYWPGVGGGCEQGLTQATCALSRPGRGMGSEGGN